MFVGSCVGAGNRHAFVLFLYWTAAGCAYAAGLTAVLLWRRRAEVAAAGAEWWRLFSLQQPHLVRPPRLLHILRHCAVLPGRA